jgi:hypothetical protein
MTPSGGVGHSQLGGTMRSTALSLAFLGVGLLAAPTPATAQDSDRPQRQSNVITLAEIEKVRAEFSDAYTLVQRLRPEYLRPTRNAGSVRISQSQPDLGPRTAKVIVDGTPHGELDVLRQIPAAMVMEIRHLSAPDATTRFGTGYEGGAILVTTR